MRLNVESNDIALWNHETKHVTERIPGNFFKDQSSCCNAKHSFDFVLILDELALMLGKHVMLDWLRDDPTTPFLRLYHILQPNLLHLKQILGLVISILLG